MNETKHSTLPWKTMVVAHSGATAVMDAEGEAVSHFASSKGDGEANAEFIVRACNAHDKLVNELRSTMSSLRQVVVALEVHGLADAAVTDAVTAIQDRLAAALAEPQESTT